MFASVIQIVYLLIILLFLSLFLVYSIYSLVGDFMGAPFVPTSGKLVSDILNKVNIKKGQVFLELGSGDGRVVRVAVKQYQVQGIGVEIHPLLVWYSRLISKLQKISNIDFRKENLFKADLSQADIIFLFLMPKTLEKLRDKFIKECKKNVLIISHGFQIQGFEKYLADKIERNVFPTYYYQINKE